MLLSKPARVYETFLHGPCVTRRSRSDSGHSSGGFEMHLIVRVLRRSLVALAAALLLTANANASGGTFRYASVSEPAPLDVMLTTAGVSLVIGMHIFEALYTIDSHYQPQPMLADGEKVSDDGKTIVITLRQGVHFHNGKEMTSDDVVASLQRWAKYGVRGKLLFVDGASVAATGKYEITISLPAP